MPARPLANDPIRRLSRTTGPLPLALLYPLFFAAVYLSHWTLLRLPYFWDEAGYYIPAALDFFHTGTLIPQSTVTNAHPPLPSILLAAWWRIAGTAIVNTRTLVTFVSAAALLGVYRLARHVAGTAAAATTLLTALYPVWFAQSTLAHADIFAAAFTLWGLSFYLPHLQRSGMRSGNAKAAPGELFLAAVLFSLAVLSKETAIATPLALAAWETLQYLRKSRGSLPWAAALTLPILPLLAWYAFHYRQTGFVFGNPEFLRYNATANLSVYRVALALWHRTLHLFTHMNMFVPVGCALAVLRMKPRRPGLPPDILAALAVILIANLLEFSILGGALLTRYLLPMFPLVLLLCVVEWQRRLPHWPALVALSAAAFLCGLWIDPPYAFAPEDNLTYRDFIVLHQHAIAVLQQRFPAATVLSAWPATSELTRPELGYTRHPFAVAPLENFSLPQMQQAAANPGSFDTALLFSTKWEPPPSRWHLPHRNGQVVSSADARFFDFHHDLTPAEAAALLHGDIVWQQHRGGEWAAILHFPRIVQASIR